MSITTFADLITDATAEKIALIEVQPTKPLIEWTQYSGSIYLNPIEAVELNEVTEDGTALVSVASLGAMYTGTFFWEVPNLYVWATTNTPIQHTVLAETTVYFANKAVTFNNHFYEPAVKTVPSITQRKTELFYAISIMNDGSVALYNNKGELDELFKNYIWNLKPIQIKLGGEQLPYSEYASMFSGAIQKLDWRSDEVKLNFIDQKVEWETSLIQNTFSLTDWPAMDPENEGKPIPLVFGTVSQAPCMCLHDATATTSYAFKCADTSLGSVQAISQVYINGLPVVHSSTNTTAAIFTLPTTAYAPGQEVSADMSGYYSGTVLIQNPVDVMRSVNDLLGIDYASQWDTATTAVAHQACEDLEFYIGLVVNTDDAALKYASQIILSCLGHFFTNNEGKYAINIFDVSVPEDLPIIDEVDIKEGSLKANLETAEIRSEFNIGWAKNFTRETYSWKRQVEATTPLIYGINRSRTLETLLTTDAGSNAYIERIKLIYSSVITKLTMALKLQLAELNIGDRFTLAWRRSREDSYPSWLTGLTVEIQQITKNFDRNELVISVDDLKGVGNAVGKWTATPPVFPIAFGGGEGSPWNTYRSRLLNGLIGFWDLDDGSGLIATDQSGYGNNGDLEGDMTDDDWVEGRAITCLDFDGIDDRLDCGTSAPLDGIGNGDFSLSFWMKSKDAIPLSYGMLFSKFADVNNRIELASSHINNQFYLVLKKTALGIATTFSVGTAPFDINWNHIVLVINRTTDLALVYMNTVKDATEINISSCPADSSNAGDLTWGARNDAAAPYEGLLDECRIYNRVLTEEEIDYLFVNPKADADAFWGAAKKNYAKQNWGYWTDANGFADPNDAETYLISRWW